MKSRARFPLVQLCMLWEFVFHSQYIVYVNNYIYFVLHFNLRPFANYVNVHVVKTTMEILSRQIRFKHNKMVQRYFLQSGQMFMHSFLITKNNLRIANIIHCHLIVNINCNMFADHVNAFNDINTCVTIVKIQSVAKLCSASLSNLPTGPCAITKITWVRVMNGSSGTLYWASSLDWN